MIHYKEISMGFKHTVRHKPYRVSEPWVSLTAHVPEGATEEEVGAIVTELQTDLHDLLDEEIEHSKKLFEEEERERKNKDKQRQHKNARNSKP